MLLLQELEAKHDGIPILLVSHGDTLSILQATMEGVDVRQHRRYGVGDTVWTSMEASLERFPDMALWCGLILGLNLDRV